MGFWSASRITSQRARLALVPIDVLVGYQKTIDATWFFERRIEPAALRASFDALLVRHPWLTGRIKSRAKGQTSWSASSPLHGWEIEMPGGDGGEVELHVRIECGSSQAAAAVDDPGGSYLRGVPEGNAVMAGRAALVSATLTNFEAGGSALGVAASHALTDAVGFHALMREWSKLHEDLVATAVHGTASARGVGHGDGVADDGAAVAEDGAAVVEDGAAAVEDGVASAPAGASASALSVARSCVWAPVLARLHRGGKGDGKGDGKEASALEGGRKEGLAGAGATGPPQLVADPQPPLDPSLDLDSIRGRMLFWAVRQLESNGGCASGWLPKMAGPLSSGFLRW